MYVSPQMSSYKSHDDFFENLQHDLDDKWGKGIIALVGDFNARTANLLETIETHDNLAQRTNIDNKVNKYGKELINLCKYNNLIIANGRNTFGYSNGGYTCQRHNGMSTIDYLITDLTCPKYIKDFKILPFNVLYN